MKRARSLALRPDLQAVPEVCMAVLDVMLLDSDKSAFFVEPVDVQAYPEYGRLIKEPMDLGQIRSRLREASYAGASFESDVRRVFWNAMLFNAPDEPVYSAAAHLLSIFEREWPKFAAEPPETALQKHRHPFVAQARASGNKLLIKLRREPSIGSAARAHQRHILALFDLTEALLRGESLEKASRIKGWRRVDEAYSSEALVAEARDLLSMLEDSQPRETVHTWLKGELEESNGSADEEYLAYYVAGVLASERGAWIDGLELVRELKGGVERHKRLWEVLIDVVAQSGSVESIVAVFKTTSGWFKKHLDLFDMCVVALRSSQSRPAVESALETIVPFLLVESNPAQTHILARMTGFKHLARAVGKIALRALEAAAPEEELREVVELCYAPGANVSLVSMLLLRGQSVRATGVAKVLLAGRRGDVLVLLQECASAAQQGDCDYQKTVEFLVRNLALSQSRTALSAVLQPSAGSRRMVTFADFVASVFLARDGLEGSLLSAVLVLAWTHNSISASIVAEAVAKIELGSEEEALEALFSLRFAPANGWDSWKQPRQELLDQLINFSAATKLEANRMQSFDEKR